MDIAKYFKKSTDKLHGRVLNSFVSCSSTSSVLPTARQMNSVLEQQDRKRKEKFYPRRLKRTWLTEHGNMEIQKLGDGLQRSTQITPLEERLVEIGR